MSLDPVAFDVMRDYLDSPCGGMRVGDVLLWDEVSDRPNPATLIRVVNVDRIRERMLAAMAAGIVVARDLTVEEAVERITKYVFRAYPLGTPLRCHVASPTVARLRVVRASGEHP